MRCSRPGPGNAKLRTARRIGPLFVTVGTRMLMRRLLAAITVAGTLIGCQKEPTSTPQGAALTAGAVKPFSVKTHEGIDHEFYRNVSLDALLKQIPSGSVDSVDMHLDKGPQ